MTLVKVEAKENECDHCGPCDGKNKKFLPHFRMEHKFFPEAKKWKVGEEYTVKLKLKMTGISIFLTFHSPQAIWKAQKRNMQMLE